MFEHLEGGLMECFFQLKYQILHIAKRILSNRIIYMIFKSMKLSEHFQFPPALSVLQFFIVVSIDVETYNKTLC
jgi:hypothetical protein